MGSETNPNNNGRNPINVTKVKKFRSRIDFTKLKNKFSNLNRSVVLASSLSGILLIVGGAAFAITKDSSKPADKSNSETTIAEDSTPKIIGKLSHKEGTLDKKTEGGEWVPTKVDDEVIEGMSLRTTGAASRGSVVFENGSIVRIDANSEIKIEVLTGERILLNQVSGYSYNRVKPQENVDYIVVSEDAQYEALGTSFRVAATGDEQAVEVYHSSVIETKSNKTARQGEKLIVKSETKPDTNKTVTKLDIEKLKSDQFITWNIELDKAIDEFKDKLGFLNDITPPTVNITSHSDGATVLLEPNATEGTIQFTGTTEKGAVLSVLSKSLSGSTPISVTIDAAGGFTTPVLQAPVGNSVFAFTAKDKAGNTTESTMRINFQRKSAPIESASIILSASLSADNKKINLTWELASGMETPDGVKVVYDITAQPLFGAASAIYADRGTSASIPVSELTKNTKYYFRACKYNKVGIATCSDYSNEVSITTPE